ncbi:hypothetical protein BGW80DRAFT_1306400, partial [Lactifluus volemus]
LECRPKNKLGQKIPCFFGTRGRCGACRGWGWEAETLFDRRRSVYASATAQKDCCCCCFYERVTERCSGVV